MANNIKQKNKRSTIGKSTHCTSFGVSNQLSLQNFKLPPDLQKALKCYLIESPYDTQLCRNYIRLINNLPNIKKIKPEHYLILFKILLYIEDNECQLLVAKHNFNTKQLRSKGSNKFLIEVPTLDENDPFITFGDIVKLQIINSTQMYYSRIVDIEGKTVVLQLFNTEHQKHLQDKEVTVYFCVSNWPIKCCHYVLHIICKHNLVDLIYPKISRDYHALLQVDLNWAHKSVASNPEQKQAVINILSNSAYPAPYIVFGPPGTGKTTTLVETICQIRNQWKSKNILVCSSSNAAADEIGKRLLALLPSKDIFRMYASSKHCENIDQIIYPSSNFIDSEVLFLPKEIFILKRVVITTLITCTRLVKLNLKSDHFSYIFIDEASQSIELESLIPFTLSSTQNKTCTGTLHAQIIIAGDPHQLGPVIRCKRIEHLLGKSLLERLMECEPYQKVENEYNSRYITKLIRNYRSQEPILHVSNILFYDNELLCCRDSNINKITLNWPLLLNKTFPILFVEIRGKEKRTLNKSVYNEEEIIIVAYYMKKLMRAKIGSRKIQEKDIGVITPFKQQKIMIDKYLNKCGLNNVTVGTVEIFQGQEKEIIILSTVRSEVFKHNDKEHIGFLSNAKRFNVALTRAKQFVIVIGNPDVLCKDRCWKTLWEYCDENNACNIIEYC
ncbi:putative helicase mov-10-B.1 [Colletes latitarsis]|uniref:putative helicase mov-10-B.1 n=1 Tax=Colletes latitarsis TaxID=2605962 RepID=UPI00403509B7